MKFCAADCPESAGFASEDLFFGPASPNSARVHLVNVSLCFSFTLHVSVVDPTSKFETVPFGYGILHQTVYYISLRLTLAPG